MNIAALSKYPGTKYVVAFVGLIFSLPVFYFMGMIGMVLYLSTFAFFSYAGIPGDCDLELTPFHMKIFHLGSFYTSSMMNLVLQAVRYSCVKMELSDEDIRKYCDIISRSIDDVKALKSSISTCDTEDIKLASLECITSKNFTNVLTERQTKDLEALIKLDSEKGGISVASTDSINISDILEGPIDEKDARNIDKLVTKFKPVTRQIKISHLRKVEKGSRLSEKQKKECASLILWYKKRSLENKIYTASVESIYDYDYYNLLSDKLSYKDAEFLHRMVREYEASMKSVKDLLVDYTKNMGKILTSVKTMTQDIKDTSFVNKLKEYYDVIIAKVKGFFGDVGELRDQLTEGLEMISELREKIKDIDVEEILSGLEATKNIQDNIEAIANLSSKLDTMSSKINALEALRQNVEG